MRKLQVCEMIYENMHVSLSYSLRVKIIAKGCKHMSGRRSVCNITPDTGAYQYVKIRTNLISKPYGFLLFYGNVLISAFAG